MKFIKTLGFAAVAAITAMALLGAGSAMANTSTSLCKVSTNPCPAASLYASGTLVEGLATNPVLLGTFFGLTGTVECEHSVVAGKTESALGNPLVGKITSITFTGNCHSSFGGSCTVTTAKTGKLDLLRTGSNVGLATSLGNEISVSCSGFPTIECTFGGEPQLTVAGSPAKTLTASNATLLAVKGSACPANPRWDAKYTLVQPTGSVFINE
jgi:hypothetical protein